MSRRNPLPLAVVVLSLGLALGCVGRGGNIVTPAMTGQSPAVSSTGQNHRLWGYWRITIDTATGRCETFPLRSADFTANVNKKVEANPGNLTITDLDTTNFHTEGRIDCTVNLKHPFPGLYKYDGFDVWGVFLHNGSTEVGYDGLTYSGGPNAGENEAVLLNPDGYTRWFNQPEFDGDGMPLFEYWSGELSNLPAPIATLNPYKVFADNLGTEDDYYQWITSGNAADRGIFRAGSVNSRRYQLRFPIIGGEPTLEFQYAVVATWEPGDPALTGDPAAYDPGDFPPSANCEEAFLLNVTTIQSDLYNDGQGHMGGVFRADVEVFDWQGGSVGHTGVPSETDGIVVVGDFVPGGSHQFSQADLATVALPGTENSSVFQVEIADCEPQAVDTAPFWLVVQAAGTNGASYGQGFPTKYPDAGRASFLRGSVSVSNVVPFPDVIYVDDSNTTGIEDGSHDHPFNTIQEGIDNNPKLKEIWVDDSGNPYNEDVQMKDNTILKSVNWDESDGTNRAFIDGPDMAGSHSVRFGQVNSASIEGFKIGPCGLTGNTMEMIGVDGGSDDLIKDCLFTGNTDNESVSLIRASGSANLSIRNCRFDSLDKVSNIYAWTDYRLISAVSCPGVRILNNIVTRIRPTEDEGSKNAFLFYIESSTGAVLKNNLIHHASPLAGVGSLGAILLEGFRFESCVNPTVINNTVDSLDVTHAFFIQQVFGYRIDNCSGVTFTNNIGSRLYSNGFPPPLARGVMAYNSTFNCGFCDIWDIGPGSNGNLYWGGATPDVTCISTDPLYIDTTVENYDLQTVSSAQMGDPTIVDWDDTGTPSGDPGNSDANTRSRMGCFGGPDGQYVGLLTP